MSRNCAPNGDWIACKFLVIAKRQIEAGARRMKSMENGAQLKD
jgi:hypothetical protein